MDRVACHCRHRPGDLMFQQELAPLGNLTVSSLVALLPLLTIFVLLGGLRGKAHWAGLPRPGAPMFHQELAPLGNLPGPSLVALLPLLTIFVLLGGLRWKAHWAGLAALVVAIVVAVAAYGMPVGLAVLAATEGAIFGLFPIMWIVFTAIWLYQVTVVSGRREDPRAAFHLISDDPRVQAIIIAFCFGGLLEALAGFGAPVAITGVMLVTLGFAPMKAATAVLLANTAPVAFGAIGIPILTAGQLTGIPYNEIGAYV